MAPRYVEHLKKCGVELLKYHPLHWFALTAAQNRNNRTHRKLLIVDGTVGFTGGVGIADEWLGNGDSKKHWRDSHYMLKGPAVAQLQGQFVEGLFAAALDPGVNRVVDEGDAQRPARLHR